MDRTARVARVRAGRGVLVLVLVLVLGGCGDGAGESGLVAVGDAATVCVPVAEDGLATVALDALHNSGSATATITAVELVDPEGLEAAGAYLVEHGGGVRAVMPGFTPAPSAAAGMTVAPDETVTLGIGLRLTGAARGHASAARVTYSLGDPGPGDTGGEQSVETVMTLAAVPAGTLCPPAD